MKYFIKNISLTLTLIFILLANSTGYAQGSSGPDRCFIDKCLCEVKPSEVRSKLNSSLSSESYTIFFKENEYKLSDKQTEDLIGFLLRNKKTKTSLSIIGYADGCGSKVHNLTLSKKRASSVYTIAKKHIKLMYSTCAVQTSVANTGWEPAIIK